MSGFQRGAATKARPRRTVVDLRYLESPNELPRTYSTIVTKGSLTAHWLLASKVYDPARPEGI